MKKILSSKLIRTRSLLTVVTLCGFLSMVMKGQAEELMLKEIHDVAFGIETIADASNGTELGYWKFDEGSGSTAYDSQNSYDGRINDAVFVTGKYGAALSFDGYNDYVDMGNPPEFNSMEAVTISAWIKPTAVGSGTEFICGKEFIYKLDIRSSGRVRFLTGTLNSTWAETIIYSETILENDTWYHVAGTYDGETKKLYINGNLESSMSQSGQLINHSKHFCVGAYHYNYHTNTYLNFYEGIIDDVRLYNYALSAEMIQVQAGEPVEASAIPGRIEAEDFDNGENGVAYYDTNPGNEMGKYRDTDVDIGKSVEGDYYVGWILDGEWLNYTVGVNSTGYYNVTARIASNATTDKTLHLESDGIDVSGPITFNTAGAGWQTWQNIVFTVWLEAGVQKLRLVMDSSGFHISYLDFEFLEPFSLPGLIEAEDFDEGGQGVAYYDTTEGDDGGAYRDTDVDLNEIPEIGFYVRKADEGEWLRYTVDVLKAGYYDVIAQVASQSGKDKTIHLEVDGFDISGPVTFNTGEAKWNDFQDVVFSVWLDAGIQQLYLVMDSGGFNINYLDFKKKNDDLVLSYDFDGDTINTAPNQLQGVAYNTQYTTDSHGNPQSALSFNGVNSYIEIENFGDVIPTEEITVSLWMKSDTSKAQFQLILVPDVNEDRDKTRFAVSVDYHHNSQNFSFWDFGWRHQGGNSPGRIYEQYRAQDTDWHHWVFTSSMENMEMSIYRDGMLIKTENDPLPLLNPEGRSLLIGGTGSGSWFKGTMDEIKIYSRALSYEEIQSLP